MHLSSFFNLFLKIISIISIFSGDSIFIFILSFSINILLSLISIIPNSNPARSISFYLKKNISIITSNYEMGSKYNDFIIIIFPILSFNNIVLYVNCVLALFITRSIDHDLIGISEISFHFAKFDESI